MNFLSGDSRAGEDGAEINPFVPQTDPAALLERPRPKPDARTSELVCDESAASMPD